MTNPVEGMSTDLERSGGAGIMSLKREARFEADGLTGLFFQQNALEICF